MARRHYRSFIMDSDRWNAYTPRPGDIVVSTPPKSGTTWMQMCCLVLVHDSPTLPAPLSVLAPWFDQTLASVDDVVSRLDTQGHRRVIKTHTPLDGVPLHDEVAYVVVARDPRDVALSFANHLANFDLDAAERAKGSAAAAPSAAFLDRPTDPVGLFSWFVEDDSPVEEFTTNLRFVLHHLSEAWSRGDQANVQLFHYSQMKRDLDRELRRLASALALEPTSDWGDLVAAASFESMKRRADSLAPNAQINLWRDNTQFFAEGRHGSWHDVVPPAALERYEERVRTLCEPDVAAWAHTP
jgi:hypothetical protein